MGKIWDGDKWGGERGKLIGLRERRLASGGHGSSRIRRLHPQAICSFAGPLSDLGSEYCLVVEVNVPKPQGCGFLSKCPVVTCVVT